MRGTKCKEEEGEKKEKRGHWTWGKGVRCEQYGESRGSKEEGERMINT